MKRSNAILWLMGIVMLLLAALAAQVRAQAPVTFNAHLVTDQAPATLHVDAVPIVELRPEHERPFTLAVWDFGDAGGSYNQIVGYNASHVYERPGTYTVRCVIFSLDAAPVGRSAIVQIKPDTRQVIEIASAQQLAANRTKSNARLKITVPALEITTSFYPSGEDSILDGGGNTLRYTGPANHQAIIGTDRTFMVRDLRIETVHAAGSGTAFRPGAPNKAAQPLTLLNVTAHQVIDFYSGNHSLPGGAGKPRYVLIQDCSVPEPTGLRDYFAWLEGSDYALIGNRVSNSTRQHIVRMSNDLKTTRVLSAHNRFVNLDRRAVDQYDDAKGVLVARGSYTTSFRDELIGPSGFEPLAQHDGMIRFGQVIETVSRGDFNIGPAEDILIQGATLDTLNVRGGDRTRRIHLAGTQVPRMNVAAGAELDRAAKPIAYRFGPADPAELQKQIDELRAHIEILKVGLDARDKEIAALAEAERQLRDRLAKLAELQRQMMELMN
jgi:plastocyanin